MSTTENTITVAIAIAIGIISLAIFLFNMTVLFLDAGNHHNSTAAAHNHHNNAYTTQETATSSLETSIVVTPSAGAKSKAASPPTVGPYISLFSPVMARILPLSPFKYSPIHFFTSHVNKPCLPAKSFKKPPLPRRSTLHHLQTSKRTNVVSLSTQKSHSKVTAKPKPAKPRVVDRTDNNNTKPLIKCFVVERNDTKPKIRTSRKPQNSCAPRLSATVSHFIETRTKVTPNGKQAKPVNRPHEVYGTDNNTESVKKHFVSEGNETKPKIFSSRKPEIPCAPRLSAPVSHFIQTRTKATPNSKQAKPVNKPRVVDGTDNNNTESVKKRFVSEGNDTKPKISRKPQLPCAPRPTAPVSKFILANCTKATPNSKQAKPVKKPGVVDNTKSMTKRFIADGNDTKPKILKSTKPQIPCEQRPTVVVSHSIQANRTKATPNGEQAKSVKKPRVVVGTDNGTKPKVLISTKQPSPPRCSNLPLQTSRPTAVLSLSTQKPHVMVTRKGCIQRWRY